MSRWSEEFVKIIKMTGEKKGSDDLMNSFFIKRNYDPQTEDEKKQFAEFSLVMSSMALLIHIAKADKIIHPEERNQIINDLVFQLEQRPFEYDQLSEKFGQHDRDIITRMFSALIDDYENSRINLDEIIRIINMIYLNNPEKRYYLIRLCFYCAYSDSYYDVSEDKVIKDVAAKLKVSVREVNRIEQEVKNELKI